MRRTKIYNLWYAIQGSLWFIPSLMIASAFCISLLSISLDRRFEYDLWREALHVPQNSVYSYLLVVGPEGARSVLATVAASMMSVAGVVFSITIVTFTLASSQFGPRLLTNFMHNRGTQVVLGSFIATFVYCLLILRSVKTAQNDIFVPTISVNISVLLAITNACILIYYIHSVASSIKAEHVIRAVYLNLKDNIEKIFQDLEPEKKTPVREVSVDEISKDYSTETVITAKEDGYVQAVDIENLLSIGSREDLVLSLELRAGKYATYSTTFATVFSHHKLDESTIRAIRDSVIFGEQRTAEQDIEFAIHQLVEIAVRSLSPGINDPFTAISCIDYMSSALCYVAQKQLPHSHCLDSSKCVRLISTPVRFADLLDSAFNQIRQNSKASVAVTIRLMEAYIRIADGTHVNAHKRELFRHAEMLKASACAYLKEEQDKSDLLERYELLEKIVEKAD